MVELEGSEGKIRAGRKRGKNLKVWSYKIATELALELAKNQWLQMVLS